MKEVKFNLTVTKWDEAGIAENSKLFLTPNPANDYITISLKPSEGFDSSEGSEIQIYNSLGECVMVVETKIFSSLQIINITYLPNGLYFIIIGNYTEKFVVVW